MRAAAGNLVRFLAEFDYSLGDLAPPQLAMFLAARNAAPLVEELEVPMGQAAQPAGDATLVQRTGRPKLEPTARPCAALAVDLPTDTMDVGQARSIEEAPRIFPLQWLWEEVEPAWFYTKLAQQELLLPRWRQVEGQPAAAASGTAGRKHDPQRAATEFARQHAYLLLDTSSTMQDHDRRGTIARGLALAFLRKGYREGAHLNLRPFAAEVGQRLSGDRREDFFAMVRRVITVPNAGQTRIQAALERAVKDLQEADACRGAQIVLITDGISRLGRNPLSGETLHTFILGDLFEEEGQQGTLQTLRLWSRTFRRIWTSRFAELLAPTWDDCRAAAAVLESLMETHRAAQGHGVALGRVARNVRFLLEQFRRGSGPAAALAAELEAMEGRLDSLESALDAADAAPGVGAGQSAAAGPGSSALARLPHDAEPPEPRGGAKRFGASLAMVGALGQWLRLWFRRLAAWLKKLVRGRFGHH